MRCTTTTVDHLSDVVKGMEKAALILKFVLTDKFGIFLDKSWYLHCKKSWQHC